MINHFQHLAGAAMMEEFRRAGLALNLVQIIPGSVGRGTGDGAGLGGLIWAIIVAIVCVWDGISGGNWDLNWGIIVQEQEIVPKGKLQPLWSKTHFW